MQKTYIYVFFICLVFTLNKYIIFSEDENLMSCLHPFLTDSWMKPVRIHPKTEFRERLLFINKNVQYFNEARQRLSHTLIMDWTNLTVLTTLSNVYWYPARLGKPKVWSVFSVKKKKPYFM